MPDLGQSGARLLPEWQALLDALPPNEAFHPHDLRGRVPWHRSHAQMCHALRQMAKDGVIRRLPGRAARYVQIDLEVRGGFPDMLVDWDDDEDRRPNRPERRNPSEARR